MIQQVLFGTLVCLLIGPLASAQGHANSSGRVELGRLANGATVTFVRSGSADWGLEISFRAGSFLSQQKPAEIEVYRADQNVRDFAVGYQSVQRESGGLLAKAMVAGNGGAAFAVEDRWKIS